MGAKDKRSLEKTAAEWAKRLAETMRTNDPAADAAFEKREVEKDARVSEALAKHLRGKRGPAGRSRK